MFVSIKIGQQRSGRVTVSTSEFATFSMKIAFNELTSIKKIFSSHGSVACIIKKYFDGRK